MRKTRVRVPKRAGRAQWGSRSVRVASCQEAFPPRCVRWQRRFYAAADVLNLMLLQLRCCQFGVAFLGGLRAAGQLCDLRLASC